MNARLDPAHGAAPSLARMWRHEPAAATTKPSEAPPPRATDALFGHADAEAALLAAYRGGRVPHAFLLVGPKGIGKATLAYRMARFVLAHPDPAAPAVQAATSLAVDPEHPVARRIAAQAHGDLLVLERTLNDKGVLRQQIAVDDVRRTVSFFGSTAGEGGWRVAIVDAVDELNRSGANALLKVLEEPPQRALLLLVCHSAARVPATLRSRCRIVHAAAVGRGRRRGCARRGDRRGRRRSADRGGGRRGRRQRRARAGLPRRGRLGAAPAARSTCSTGCPRSMPTRCMRSATRSPAPIRSRSPPSSIPSMPGCRGGSIATQDEIGRLARLAEAWERINQAARDAETYNLERKPLVFSVFGLLAEATRG